MKLFFSLILCGGVVLTNKLAFGQYIPGALGYHEQALMFSNYTYGGSARIQGIGSTQISLGGDISSALANPAGLGFYNRSEFSITPALNISTANSAYLTNNINSSTTKFNINNLGVVVNKTLDDATPGKWRGGSFAISFSKVNDFNGTIQYSGENPNNDILDFYVQDANYQNVDGEELRGITYGAYSTYLLSEFLDAEVYGNDTSYIPFYDRTFFGGFPREETPTLQTEIISTTGGQNQWNFSAGGNYGDVFYFGGTVGVQSLKYNIIKNYTESYPGFNYDIVTNSSLIEDLITEGTGINASLGIILRPVNILTLGFSYITPTYFSISERYYYSTKANYDNFLMENYGDYFDANYDFIYNPNVTFTTFYEDNTFLSEKSYDEESYFDYTLITPGRINAGATFFINKNGFVSADIEYVDYASMKLKGDQYPLDDDNEDIQDLYSSVLNIRIGGELRLNSFRFRAGYNYKPSPYDSKDTDQLTQVISAGLGYRSSKFFVDLAASQKLYNGIYSPYILDNPEEKEYLETSLVAIDNQKLNIALSLGLFF